MTDTLTTEENEVRSHRVSVRPYGDKLDDGMVQLSFTLPTKASAEAREAAILIVEQMGLEKIHVAHMESISEGFTLFIIYAKCPHSVDMSLIKVTKLENPYLNFEQINEYIKNKIGRKLVVVGACIGSDAHTVGIDAMFNMKGYAHDWGFERYEWMSAHNLRAQVAAEDLISKLVELKADAVLISRVVTQRDEHIVEFKNFLELLKNRTDIPAHLIKICGGPRVTHQEALSWGYDAGFGPGTKPSEVASLIVYEFHKRCPEFYTAPKPQRTSQSTQSEKTEDQAQIQTAEPEEAVNEDDASSIDSPVSYSVDNNETESEDMDTNQETENDNDNEEITKPDQNKPENNEN